MAVATERRGIQFRVLNSSEGPAVHAVTRPVPIAFLRAAIRHRREPARPDASSAIRPSTPAVRGDRWPASSRMGCVPGGYGGADRRPPCPGWCMSACKLRGGPRGRPPGQRLGVAAARAGAPDRAAQDRDAATSRGRTIDFSAWRRGRATIAAPVFSFMGHRSCTHTRCPAGSPIPTAEHTDHPRWARPLAAALHRGRSGRRPPLLSVDRGTRSCRFPDRQPRPGSISSRKSRPRAVYPDGCSTSPAVRRRGSPRAVDEGL